jgi:hypothetical protein
MNGDEDPWDSGYSCGKDTVKSFVSEPSDVHEVRMEAPHLLRHIMDKFQI